MNARKTAWNILCRVLLEGGYASLLMRNMPKELSAEDRALVSEIVYGTLRNRDMLEWQWNGLAKGRVRPKTAILLDLSVYQIQYMDRIPVYAVIDEAVELAEKREKGFVNAVLRAVTKQGKQDAPGEGLEQEAIRTSHPLFLLKLWSAQYGEATAFRIAEHDQKPSRVYARINTLKAERSEFEIDGVTFYEKDCFCYDGDLVHSSWLQEGKALIQDRASQKVAPLLDAQPGMRVLDVCASPGTKTQQIACAMRNEGWIDAHDLYAERVKLIDALMDRTGVSIVHASVHDGTVPLSEESYDRILIDAPCSGLGDLSHKPEIRFHVTPESLDELTALQGKILEANAGALKPGGKLVYSTCTLNRKENEGQIRRFLKAHPEYQLLEEHTVFPFEEDTDGFYMACLLKSL